MTEVSFPGLNLNFNINRTAIKLGEVDIYWYGVIIVSAFLIALLLMRKDDKKYDIEYETIVELAIWVIPISIICARIYYVIFRLDYYSKNLIQIINFRNGGLAIYGGIIGAIITITMFCKKRKINALDILDFVAPYLPLRTSNWKMG